MSNRVRQLDVGIIGCGCSGLVTLKELICEGHRCTVFEKSNCLGGLYTQAYEEGVFVSSHLLTMFGDFVGREEDEILVKPRMLSFGEYVRYLNDYAEHFRLNSFIRYQTEVQCLSKDYSTNKWLIRVKNDPTVYEFDRIAICSGTYGEKSMPTFINEDVFQGDIRHLKDVRCYEEFRDKRVCIVGSGESASDMILAAAQYGEKAYLSIRNDHGFLVPRYIHGNANGPADLDTSRIHHSIPRGWGVLHTAVDMYNSLIKSYLKCYFVQGGQLTDYDRVRRAGIWMNLKQIRTSHIWNTFGTKNSNLVEALVKYPSKCHRKPGIHSLKSHSIVFDDQTEETVDQILCCTGFQSSFDYFDQTDPLLREASLQARKSHCLYKHCFHPSLGSEICWIGFARPALGAVPPLMELQARWFALLCSNKLHLPEKNIIEQRIEKYIQYLRWQLTPYRTARLTNLTDYLIYSDDLARTIGCRPNFMEIFFSDPYLWLKLMCGPLMNAHYRLHGPHAKPKQARRTILKAKWVKQPNVLYSVMLFFYSFFWFVFGIESCRPVSWYSFD